MRGDRHRFGGSRSYLRPIAMPAQALSEGWCQAVVGRTISSQFAMNDAALLAFHPKDRGQN
jgi:hypothetical protein